MSSPRHDPARVKIKGQLTRRCLVTAKECEAKHLVRFVVGPAGEIVPDLKGQLPGRGLWVEASGDNLRLARQKNLFARAAKRPVVVPDDLPQRVENLLAGRILGLLGLARKMGTMVCGYEKVRELLRSGGPALLIEASDGAQDGRAKVLRLLEATVPKLPIAGCFSSIELSLAFGRDSVVHAGLEKGGLADTIVDELARLGGFRDLCPADWQKRTYELGAASSV